MGSGFKRAFILCPFEVSMWDLLSLRPTCIAVS